MDKHHPSYFGGKAYSVIVRSAITGETSSYDVSVEYIESLNDNYQLEAKVIGTKYSKPYLIVKKGEKKIINYR